MEIDAAGVRMLTAPHLSETPSARSLRMHELANGQSHVGTTSQVLTVRNFSSYRDPARNYLRRSCGQQG